MGTKLSAEDASAYEALDRLLFRQWDPIGIGDSHEAEDEYRAYLPGFWSLVRAGVPEVEVVDYLTEIETDRMSIETTFEHKVDVVRKATALVAAWQLPVRP